MFCLDATLLQLLADALLEGDTGDTVLLVITSPLVVISVSH